MNSISDIARYAVHRVKSKRLHGVHSPFVYAYAETVLNRIGPTIFQILFRPQAHIALRYLKESLFFLDPACISYSESVPSMDPEPAIDRGERGGSMFPDAFVTGMEDITNITTLPDLTLIYLPHRKSNLWKEIIRSERFNLTMDMWFVGIAINHTSFLQKQHFDLR